MIDAASLIERIRREREVKIPFGRWTFHARRPTDMEAGDLFRERATTGSMALRFVSGWEGMRLCDLVGGEDEKPVDFDPVLWREWVVDQPEVYKALGDRMMELYLEHSAKMEADRKN